LVTACRVIGSASASSVTLTAVTDPLYAWFRGIVPSPSLGGGATLALPLVIAILVYRLAHIGVRGLLRVIAHRRTEV